MGDEYIQLMNVNKIIKKSQILNNISLKLDRNKIYGFRGINGSGKTMLLRAMAGLIKVKGKVIIDGKEIGNHNYPNDMGILIENPTFLSEFTAFENLQLIAMIDERITDQDIYDALQLVGLNPTDRRKYKKFSLGMKERLGIAQAILGFPKLILLDEPTNAIDREGIALLERLLILLKEKGSTIIVTSHDNIFLENVSDKIYIIKDGAIEG